MKKISDVQFYLKCVLLLLFFFFFLLLHKIYCYCRLTFVMTCFVSRHPSNLMLDRMSGKIIHIDFGDCFEVAMVREKFPEKIPFRLTRMLKNAMEV